MTTITDDDRAAAADAVMAYRDRKNGDWQARIRRGECDDGYMVQAFARHREQALEKAAGDEVAIERAAKAHCDYFGGDGWWDTGLIADTKPEALKAMKAAIRALKGNSDGR